MLIENFPSSRITLSNFISNFSTLNFQLLVLSNYIDHSVSFMAIHFWHGPFLNLIKYHEIYYVFKKNYLILSKKVFLFQNGETSTVETSEEHQSLFDSILPTLTFLSNLTSILPMIGTKLTKTEGTT